jgi:hypothetical protein
MLRITPNQIRFLRRWRGREPGDTNADLLPGVMEQLVRRGVAEIIQPEKKTSKRQLTDRVSG